MEMHEMLEPKSSFPPSRKKSKAQRRADLKATKNASQCATSPEAARKPLAPRNANQARLIDALHTRPVVFAIGPAGVGKTYIAARFAMEQMMQKNFDRIICTRPTEAPQRHRLGFQPGGINAKMKPWMVPIWDGFKAETSGANVDKFLASGQVEIVPFEFMRGRTFNDSAILLDEAQNCSLSDLELVITRIGEDSTLIISGDPYQVDESVRESGLVTIFKMVEQFNLNAGAVFFTEKDVERSRTAKEWVSAFRRVNPRQFH